jgi:hypothetical protein
MRGIRARRLNSSDLKSSRLYCGLAGAVRVMETSLISAFIGSQVGEMQLAVAARLGRMNDANSGSSIVQLVDAADQSANSLANAAGIGKNLNISA